LFLLLLLLLFEDLCCCFACTRLSDCCQLTVNKESLTTTYYYYYSKSSLSLFDTCRWKRTGLSFHPLFSWTCCLSTHKIGGRGGGEREYIQKDGLPTPKRAELQIGHKRGKWPGVSQASLHSQIGVTKRAESRTLLCVTAAAATATVCMPLAL